MGIGHMQIQALYRETDLMDTWTDAKENSQRHYLTEIQETLMHGDMDQEDKR